MSVNLLSLAQQALGGDFSKMAGQFLGESETSTQSAMSSLLPAILGTVAQQGATPHGAASLLSAINNPQIDTGILGNVASLFGGGGSGMQTLMKLGSSTLVPALFGDKAGGLVNALVGGSGIKSSSATNLLGMAVPLVLAFLKKFVGEKKVDAAGLSSLLVAQGPHLQGSIDSRMASALGFASPTAFLSSLGGAAVDTTKRAGAAVASGATAAASTAAHVATESKSGLMRWLPWLIGLALLWFLWNMFSGKPAPTPEPAPAPAPAMAPKVEAPAPAPAMAPAAVGLPTKVYFDVGSAALGGEGAKITAAADAIKKDNLKVDLTGYTDKTGDEAKNLELAKQRALAVKAALIAAGVGEGNIEMKPPMFVTGSVVDAEARRVDISKQ
jgi:outer membrane protein OmpA-like peptidoglycan-associated protein